MKMPRTVDVEITSSCNLRCRYCYFFDNPGPTYEDLPTREWLSFFSELGEAAVMDVTLAGGEPFIRSDLPELIDAIVRNRMRFSLLSNGTLITDEIAASIAESGRCNHVQVSLDGSRAETHDACRGAGSFERAVAGIKTLQRAKVSVTVRVTVHRHNVDDLEQVASFLLDELGLPGFSTNAASYLGTCRHNADSVMLTTEDRTKAMATMSRLAAAYPGRIQAAAGPLAEARMFTQMERARRQAAPAFPDGGKLTGCGCPWSKVAVRNDGVLVPCNLLPHLELGRINRDRLLDVWQHSPVLDSLRHRREIPLTGFDFCRACPYTAYCTGSCPATSYSELGEVNHPSPSSCYRRYLADGGTLGESQMSNQGLSESGKH